MCGSGASRQTTSGGLSPNGKVSRRSSRNWGFVFAPASRRMKTLVNLAMLRLGAVSATLATVLLVAVVFSRGWRAWTRVGAGGRVRFTRPLSVRVGSSWRACVGYCRSGAAGLVRCGESRLSLSAWYWRRVMDNARPMMLSIILSRSTVPGPGASCPPTTPGKSCSGSSFSSPCLY